MKTLEEFMKRYKFDSKKEAKKEYDLYQKNLSFFEKILANDKKNPGGNRGLGEDSYISTTYKRL
jgi:FMN-dependent NADH-azoreductase